MGSRRDQAKAFATYASRSVLLGSRLQRKRGSQARNENVVKRKLECLRFRFVLNPLMKGIKDIDCEFLNVFHSKKLEITMRYWPMDHTRSYVFPVYGQGIFPLALLAFENC